MPATGCAAQTYVVRQGASFRVIAIGVGLALLAALFGGNPRRTAIAQAHAAFGPWEGPALVALFAAACVLHELSHGVVGRWGGGGPVRYGARCVLRLVPLAFYCALDGTLSRAGAAAVLLAPQVAVPAALGAVALAAPAAWGLCWLVYMLMVIGSASDLLMLVVIQGSRARRLQNTAAGVVEVTDAIRGGGCARDLCVLPPEPHGGGAPGGGRCRRHRRRGATHHRPAQ